MGTEVSSADMGAASTMTHGVSCTRMHGCVKADDDNVGMNVGTHESCGVGDRCRRRVVGTQEHVENEEVWMCLARGVTLPNSMCLQCRTPGTDLLEVKNLLMYLRLQKSWEKSENHRNQLSSMRAFG